MRKSGNIILTTIFISAITTCSATAQDLAQDSTSNSVPYSGHGYNRFFFWGRHSNNTQNNSANVQQTNKPRTGGFGNTLRKMFSPRS